MGGNESVNRRGARLKRAVIVMASTALVAVGLVAVPALGQDGEHPDLSDFPNDGVLRLHMGADDFFQYQAWDPGTETYLAPSSTQPVGPAVRCEVDVSGPLVNLDSAGSIGEFDNYLGIRVRGARGIGCSRVDLSEGPISLSLTGTLGDKLIDYAEIDIEGKQNVVLGARAYIGNVPVGETQTVLDCERSDCGPDNDGTDNFRIVLEVDGQDGADGADGTFSFPSPFNRVDLMVLEGGGEFSLGGGTENSIRGPLGSFLHTDDTLFHLTEVDVLECGEETDFSGQGVEGTVLLANCDGAKLVFFTSQPVDAGDGDVDEVSYGNVGGGIEGSYTLERWIFDNVPEHSTDTDWPPSPAGDDPRLWYNDDPLQDPDNDRVAPFCDTDPRSGPFQIDDGEDPGSILPDGHTTCIIVDQRTVTSSVEGDFILFSIGDPKRGFR